MTRNYISSGILGESNRLCNLNEEPNDESILVYVPMDCNGDIISIHKVRYNFLSKMSSRELRRMIRMDRDH